MTNNKKINSFDYQLLSKRSLGNDHISSVWHGTFQLPLNTFAVRLNTSLIDYSRKHKLTLNSPVFLKNGYIVINMQIKTRRKTRNSMYDLSYFSNQLRNQWKNEGFNYSASINSNLFKLYDGDIIFYDTNLRMNEDLSNFLTN
jgi:hypothetical protein